MHAQQELLGIGSIRGHLDLQCFCKAYLNHQGEGSLADTTLLLARSPSVHDTISGANERACVNALICSAHLQDIYGVKTTAMSCILVCQV